MARQRKEKSAKDIKLKQPDRSGPDPTEKTLLQLAEERQLFQQAQQREKELGKKKNVGDVKEEDLLSPGEERFIEAVLYTATLAMVHFTFDVLVQHQYAAEIEWQTVCIRTALAWLCTTSHSLQPDRPANIGNNSLLHHLLPTPPSRRKPDSPSWPETQVPTPVAPDHLLRHEHPIRVLPDLHHKHVRIPRCHEESAPDWLSLDMGCH